MLTGLVVLGFALEEAWHYMIAALGWGFYVFVSLLPVSSCLDFLIYEQGIMITTVAITSYNLDCYPEGSGEVAAWINFARTTGKWIFTTTTLIKLNFTQEAS